MRLKSVVEMDDYPRTSNQVINECFDDILLMKFPLPDDVNTISEEAQEAPSVGGQEGPRNEVQVHYSPQSSTNGVGIVA